MKILRRYQLDIIFLFFALLLIVWTAFYGLKHLGVDPHIYEWYIAGPIILLYFAVLIRMRGKIQLSDRRQLTGKSLVYWIAFGISVILTYSTPIPANDYWSINAFFLVFTLLLADSYWDFRGITLERLFKNG